LLFRAIDPVKFLLQETEDRLSVGYNYSSNKEDRNHFFISGTHFVEMNGIRIFPSADLAFRIISLMLRLTDGNDENREEQGEEEQDRGEDDDNDGLDQELGEKPDQRKSRTSRSPARLPLDYLPVDRTVLPTHRPPR
jgi:hypothetical protein